MKTKQRFSAAYGLRIEGFTAPELLATEVRADWPLLTLTQNRRRESVVDPPEPGMLRCGTDTAEVWFARGMLLEMTREPLQAHFLSDEPISDQAMLHPFLAAPAAIASFWLGRQALHGAAFARDGRAYCLLGDREMGKSSILAAVARAGAHILSDDLIVVEGKMMFTGPPFVDLRGDAAAVFGGEPVGVLGNRPRWRLTGTQAPAAVPLGGFIELVWGDEISALPLGLEHRLALLVNASQLALNHQTASSLLELLELPVWRFTRPRNLAIVPQSVAHLLDALDRG